MRINHFIFNVCVFGVLAVFMCGTSFAGGGFEVGPADLETGSIGGNEAWAVFVIQCSDISPADINVTLRAKSIEGCNVNTDALVFPEAWASGSCPTTEAELKEKVLYFAKMGANILGGYIPNPIVTKVKNVSISGNTISFDAQLRNYIP